MRKLVALSAIVLLCGLIWAYLPKSERTLPETTLSLASIDTPSMRTEGTLTPAQRERIVFLRAALPGNSLVPTDDEAEQELRDERAAAQDRMQPRIIAGEASEAEVRAFYDSQRAGVRDRIALAKFILAEPQWSPSVREKYERVLTYAQGQLQRIDTRETASLAHQRVK